jgi:hypothetical protein
VAYFSTNGDKTFLNVAKMAPDGSISSVKSVWESTGYPIELFSDRIVSGDFNRDGYFDDIAVMCDYGGGETRIHVFEGTGLVLYIVINLRDGGRRQVIMLI